MASVTKKGNTYSIRIYLDGKQKKLRGGFTNKRLAERTGEKVESLLACRRVGCLTDEVRLWLEELKATKGGLYDHLADLGLVEERQEEKTLYGLLNAYKAHQSTDVSNSTIQTYEMVEANLRQFFGKDVPLSEINRDVACRFAQWLKTEKLNRRGKNPQRYGAVTVNKRLGIAKQFFKYAEIMGWILKNPFQIVKAGETTNPDKLEYVPVEKVLRVMEYSPLKWRVLFALGRFCGLRGSSEVHCMEWENIHWSSSEEPGWIAVKAGKNRRHGRRFRMVPMCPVVERVLSDWFHQSKEGEPLLFPGMKARQNFSVMTEKQAVRALGGCWVNPWYNLRKSFCCDLLPAVRDIRTYETITDHSYQVAVKHYQIMTKGRSLKGIGEATTLYSSIAFPSQKYDTCPSKTGVLKRGLVGALKGDLHGSAGNGKKQKEMTEAIENTWFMQKETPACDGTQTGGLVREGFEPPTKGL